MYLCSGGKLTCLRHGGPTLPGWLVGYNNTAPDAIIELEASNGQLEDLAAVGSFGNLETLVADGNLLRDISSFPPLHKLRTLSLNKNRLNDLQQLLVEIRDRYPNLTYLSLIGNPCCPAAFGYDNRDAYDAYAITVSAILPGLRFLDSNPIEIPTANLSQKGGGVANQIHTMMLLTRFRQLVASAREQSIAKNSIQPGDPGYQPGPLTYLRVKKTLIAEFGVEAFDSQKMHVADVLQQIEEQHAGLAATNDYVDNDRPLLDGMACVGAVDRWNADSSNSHMYAPGSRGSLVRVRIRRPTVGSVGFRVVGGCDKAYGAAFVSKISSTAAKGLEPGDRLLAAGDVGLALATQSRVEEVLARLPLIFEILVLRIGSDEWNELKNLVATLDDPLYGRCCRALNTIPLMIQAGRKYDGLRDPGPVGKNERVTRGEIKGIHLLKARGTHIGLQMAGAYELGGVFVTQIAPGSVAAAEPDLTVGCRVLEVAGRSILFANQDDAGALIHSTNENEVEIVVQQLDVEQWAEVCRAGKDNSSLQLANQAQALRDKGQLEGAIERYLEAQKVCERLSILECQILAGLGSAHFSLKLFKKSANYHGLEAQAWQEIGNPFAEARALDCLGLAHRFAKDYSMAVLAYEGEQRVAEKVKDMKSVGRALANLGITFGAMKLYDRAIDCHTRSLACARDLGDVMGEARGHGNLGVTYGLMKEYNSALESHEARLRIAEKLNDRDGQFRALGNLCGIAKVMKNQAVAKLYWERQQKLVPNNDSSDLKHSETTAAVNSETPVTKDSKMVSATDPSSARESAQVFKPEVLKAKQARLEELRARHKSKSQSRLVENPDSQTKLPQELVLASQPASTINAQFNTIIRPRSDSTVAFFKDIVKPENPPVVTLATEDHSTVTPISDTVHVEHTSKMISTNSHGENQQDSGFSNACNPDGPENTTPSSLLSSVLQDYEMTSTRQLPRSQPELSDSTEIIVGPAKTTTDQRAAGELSGNPFLKENQKRAKPENPFSRIPLAATATQCTKPYAVESFNAQKRKGRPGNPFTASKPLPL